jgi:hypothetical protein
MAAFVVQFAMFGQPATKTGALDRAEIERAIERVLRWKAYWEGADSFFGSYVPGQRTEVKLIRSRRGVAVFIAGLGVNVQLQVSPEGGIIGVLMGQHIAGETNASAAARYLQRPETDCIPVTKRGSLPSRSGRVVSARRGCYEGSPDAITEEDISLVLPALDVPQSITERKAPPSVADLTPLVEKAMASFGQRECSPVRGVIPFFADEDPWVYVVLERCGERAVQLFSRDTNGSWEIGQLLLDRLPNQLSRLIAQIEKAAMTKLSK